MKIVLYILGGLVALVMLLALVGLLLPRRYRVERSAVIKAKPEVVFAQVADLRAWKNWGVWFERDPQMQINYSENTAAVGGWSEWKSKSQGSGKATLTRLTSSTEVEYSLQFEGMGFASQGRFALTPVADGVRVVWADTGDLGLNPISRWFGLFLDRMIGPDFAAGLAKLRSFCEKTPN
jgi:Polyketide cyclase / dehydrase and lipid transport